MVLGDGYRLLTVEDASRKLTLPSVPGSTLREGQAGRQSGVRPSPAEPCQRFG